MSQALAFIERLPHEGASAIDSISGLPLQRLTGAIGHSHCLYFTSDGWTNDGQHLLIASERAPSGNQLYALELASGDLLRLTNLAPGAVRDHRFNYASLDPAGQRVAFWDDQRLTVLNLVSGAQQVVYEAPGDIHGTCWTADGAWILTCASSAGTHSTGVSTAERLSWMQRPPRSQVLAVAADGNSPTRILHEEDWLITHVNASPTDPDLVVFCHEGPWLDIPQRVWGLRLSGGAAWPVGPANGEWGIGHEYWLADGRSIGYHARHREGSWRHAAGFVDVAGGSHWQAELSVPTHHAVAIDGNRIYLDGTRESGGYLLAVDREGDGWGTPRVLCRHDASRHHHRAHVHPRPRRDGRAVVFNSDRRGYCDAWLVEVPESLDDLPPWPGRPYRYYWE